ncbi:Putative terminase large subunit [Fibrisoma limi BUZ 3]|uniref:Putative terminase large subunit n=1 Tax=Fibrisoma limi BUZ 3 TaxID=1185876 RepID=I2GKP8_9BACT|nr:terminase TerL endonuclease subunit [Fibrisoma limi]CCH54474.1 Putative terminase large subunit [Fibrisoma limi BUZ 3]
MPPYPLEDYNEIARQYEEDILSGRIVAGRLLRLAIERQRDDLEHGHERGLYFDHDAGQKILDFADCVNIGPDQPFHLFPFQVWELYVFYGWKREDGRRRFRRKYKSCARGNGKTPLESLQIHYHLTVEGLQNAEAYVSATKEKQAKIAFDDAVLMLDNSPDLQEYLDQSAEQIFNRSLNAKFSFLTSSPKTADGTRPSFAVIDEYHEFENDGMVNKLSSGLIKKKEPIMSIVTTRGSHQEWPCFQKELKVYIPILERSVENDSFFVVIYSQDSEEELQQPETWQKSNPMLCEGGILDLETLIEERDAKILEGEEGKVSFLTLNLNWWCDAPQVFIPNDIWIKGNGTIDIESLYERECWAGLDMGQTNDFCALSLFFPPADWSQYDEDLTDEQKEKLVYLRTPTRVPGEFTFLWWFWIPRLRYNKRVADGLHSLRDWERNKLIYVQEGNVIDPREIDAKLLELAGTFNIRMMTYDRYNANATALTMQEKGGVPVLEFPQTMPMYAEPTRSFRDIVLQERIRHGGNPIAEWMMRNSRPITDTNGNIKITKDPKRSPDKVDGIVAAIMAQAGWMYDRNVVSSNVYDQRGFLEW